MFCLEYTAMARQADSRGARPFGSEELRCQAESDVAACVQLTAHSACRTRPSHLQTQTHAHAHACRLQIKRRAQKRFSSQFHGGRCTLRSRCPPQYRFFTHLSRVNAALKAMTALSEFDPGPAGNTEVHCCRVSLQSLPEAGATFLPSQALRLHQSHAL